LEVITTDERAPQKRRREKGQTSLDNERNSSRKKINMVSKREMAKIDECPQSIALRLIIKHNLWFGTLRQNSTGLAYIFHIYCFQTLAQTPLSICFEELNDHCSSLTAHNVLLTAI
jgi:hypothetical protein